MYPLLGRPLIRASISWYKMFFTVTIWLHGSWNMFIKFKITYIHTRHLSRPLCTNIISTGNSPSHNHDKCHNPTNRSGLLKIYTEFMVRLTMSLARIKLFTTQMLSSTPSWMSYCACNVQIQCQNKPSTEKKTAVTVSGSKTAIWFQSDRVVGPYSVFTSRYSISCLCIKYFMQNQI